MSRQASDAVSLPAAATAAADATPGVATAKAAEGEDGGQDRALQAGLLSRKVYVGTDSTGGGLRSGAQSAHVKAALGSSALTGR